MAIVAQKRAASVRQRRAENEEIEKLTQEVFQGIRFPSIKKGVAYKAEKFIVLKSGEVAVFLGKGRIVYLGRSSVIPAPKHYLTSFMFRTHKHWVVKILQVLVALQLVDKQKIEKKIEKIQQITEKQAQEDENQRLADSLNDSLREAKLKPSAQQKAFIDKYL